MDSPVIIFSAPSGAGKGTIIQEILKDPRFSLSVSATTREPREGDVEGETYYFLSEEEFRRRAQEGEFVEWEEVYPGLMYGTLYSELERLWVMGKVIIFEIDVNGALQMKHYFEDQSLSVFITPPDLETLERRLQERDSETEESLRTRLDRASYEMSQQHEFDVVIINDNLDQAISRTQEQIETFLGQ